MSIIAKRPQFTRVGFVFNRENEHIHNIPAPTALWLLGGSKGGLIVVYELLGEFSTKKPALYLNDVIKRYMQTYDCLHTNNVPITMPHFDNGVRYDLGEISKGLESLKARASAFPDTKRVYTGKEDRLFWTAKEFCEMSIRRKQVFTEFDIKQVILLSGGTYSEAKAKSKSIYNWYESRGFKGSERVFEMSREENAKKQAQALADKTRAHVRSVAMTFKNLNQKITAVAVAEAAQVSRPTASKYLKELREEGLI